MHEKPEWPDFKEYCRIRKKARFRSCDARDSPQFALSLSQYAPVRYSNVPPCCCTISTVFQRASLLFLMDCELARRYFIIPLPYMPLSPSFWRSSLRMFKLVQNCFSSLLFIFLLPS